METREYSICGFSINYLIKVIIFLIFITFCFYGLDVSAQENKKIETVIIEGVGATVESASINAGKNAVRQVVGMYTVTDTVVENSKLIKDQILSNSNGFIKSFKILNTTENDGLFYVEAKVEVVLGSVISRLNDNNIVTHDIGSTSFKVVALDKFDVQNNFKELAEKVIFEPLKLNKNVYKLQILDFRASDKDKGLLFKEINGRNKYNLGDLVTFDLKFKMSFNNEYFNSINEFLTNATKNNNSLKYPFPMFQVSANKIDIKTYKLSKKQKYILYQLFIDFLSNYTFKLKTELLANGTTYYYVKYAFAHRPSFSVPIYNSPGTSRDVENNLFKINKYIKNSNFEIILNEIDLLIGIPEPPNAPHFTRYILDSNNVNFTTNIILDRESIKLIDDIRINARWYKNS